MNWFLPALICTLGWGFADLFYKKGTDENDRYSHLKIAVWVGLVMGVAAICMLPFSESGFDVKALLVNGAKYLPASLSYIISMVIGYAGLRYLELSVVSPVQNASGAFSTIAMLIYFTVIGKISSFTEEFSVLDIIGTGLIVVGLVALAIVEQRISKKEAMLELRTSEDASAEESEDTSSKETRNASCVEHEKTSNSAKTLKKYTVGALALIFPFLYCIFDTAGTAFDGIILDGEAGLGLGEIDVLILYGLTFLIAGIGAFIFLAVKTKKCYNPFALKTEWPKATAACAEEFGQVFYVFAMARKPMLVAPMVASYCIVSVILSRIFLKEKLKASQYAAVITVIIGIVLLGISEGLAEE